MILDDLARGVARLAVDADDHVSRATWRETRERHVSNVDLVATQNRADLANHAGLVHIFEHEQLAVREYFDLAAVDVDDAGLVTFADQRTGGRKHLAVSRRGLDLNQIGV